MNTKAHFRSLIVAGVIYTMAIVVALSGSFDNKYINVPVIITAFCAFHLVVSIMLINERELGAMFFLGRPLGDLNESGPYFAFWPFVYIRKATRNIVQIEIGVLTPEEKQKAKALEGSASLFLFEDPLHVNWSNLKSADYKDDVQKKMEAEKYKDDPLAKSLVTETHVTVRFEIFSLTAVIRKAGSLEEAIELIQRATIAALISYAGKSFVARAISNMEDVDNWLKNRVEEFVADPGSEAFKKDPGKSWGVNIRKTQITRIGTAKRISEAQADQGKTIYNAQAEKFRLVETAQGQSEATKLQALADRIKFSQEGAGKAEAEKFLLFARQEGLQKLAQLANTTEGQIVLQLEALEKGLEFGKTVIIPAELSSLVGVLSKKLTRP